MHDLSLNLFYKTEFDIQTVDPEGDALWELVMGIRGWICGKWARSHVEIPRDVSRWTQFKKGLSADLDDADRVVHFDSAAFWTSDEMGRWACSITETVQDTSHAPRQWVTEIGFLEESRGKGRVSLVLTYGDRPGFLGSVQPEPSASIPRLVKDLLDNDRLRCTVSGTPAPAQPIELCVGEFPKFWELVSDERRDAPVVLVSPRFPSGEQASLLVDPAHISDALGPSAFVFYTTDQDFCAEMAYELPYDTLRCSNGAVRIYAEHPRMDEPGDSRRHRFFSARSIEEIGSARFVEMLRRALAQDVNFYERMVRVDSVRAELRGANAEKRAAERLALTEDQALQEIEKMDSELDGCKAKRDACSSENDELRDKVHALEGKNDYLENALSIKNDTRGLDVEVGKWPASAREIAGIFCAAYPNRIAFTSRGRKSLDDCRTSADVLWNALYDLCTIAYEWYGSRQGGDLKEWFESRSTFEFSPSAGMMTRNDKGLMQEYQDTFQGRPITCEAHIGTNNDGTDARFFRVYFTYDEQTRLIVISSCGKHLDNYSTRSLK